MSTGSSQPSRTPMRSLLRRIGRTARRDDGISLVMAIGILGVLSIVGAAVIYYAGSNSRSAEYSNADNRAYALAESGIADARARLADAPNPTSAGILGTPQVVTHEGGKVTYSGVLSADAAGNAVWTITATSDVDNPTGPGAEDISRTVTQKVRVRGVLSGADPQLWDRIFHDRTDKCFSVDTVTLRSSVTSRGDLCLENGGRIEENSTASGSTTVLVGDDVSLQPGSSIGSSGTPVGEVQLGGLCTLAGSSSHTPCGSADQVYATTSGDEPTNLSKPQVDLAYWYENAKPGPNHNCTSGSFPGGFDNDGVQNGTHSSYGEITPEGASYSCIYAEGGETVGEISWDHTSGVLTIQGTIFIDGDVRFDDDGSIVNYNGRAIIYAGDDVEFDERVCAGGDGSTDCRGDMSNWNPEENMLILLSNGWSEYDQGGNLAPAAFQGVVYSRDFCLVHQDVFVSGPILCDEIRIEENDEDQGGGWPSFFSWPELQSLVPGVLYGDLSTSTEYEFELIEQTG